MPMQCTGPTQGMYWNEEDGMGSSCCFGFVNLNHCEVCILNTVAHLAHDNGEGEKPPLIRPRGAVSEYTVHAPLQCRRGGIRNSSTITFLKALPNLK